MTNTRTEHERDLALEDFAAALTEAVYPVVLRQQPKCSWLDLELNLWQVLGQTIQAMTDASPLLKLMPHPAEVARLIEQAAMAAEK